jgi:uncharacterized protein GlcG (DUF336 family)
MITLHIANRIAVAAFEEGKARGVLHMSVVVTDASGAIRVAMRGDGVGTFGVDIAKGKAATALGFNTSSLQLGEWFGQNVAATAGLAAVTDGQFLPLGGGVIVQDEAGVTIGAAAVAGGAPETDHAVVVAAVKAVGLVAPE